MSPEWKRLLVSELADNTPRSTASGPFGSNLISSDYTDCGVPVIRGANMSKGRWVEGEFVWVSEEKAEQLSSNHAFPGELVFTQRGTLGQVCLVPPGAHEKYVLSQSQMKLRVDPSICDSLFMLYQFRTPEQQAYIDMNAIQVGVPHTNLGILRETPCQVPPLLEQKAIAHILGTLDDKIELNRKTNETLEAMAKALFKSWFVDFDPVRAKVEGRPTGLPDEISNLFPDSFEESELGEIPSGWEVSNIAGIANVEMGQSPSGESCSVDPAGLPLLNGPTEFGEFCPTPVQYTSNPKRYCQSGDLLFCVRGSTTGRMNWSDQSYAIGRGLAAITSSGKDHALMIRVLIEESLPNLLAKATGSTFPSVSRKDIESISVFIPAPSIRYLCKDVCSSAYERMALCFKNASTLIQIRDALLPRLISGEIRIPDAERMLEDVGI
ncbi:MAG: restriction endonuclease subunit S [Cyanobium sp. CZS 25K]|nr:restriction endonuclease subunit S [Cyanobium sp. CZS25K]